MLNIHFLSFILAFSSHYFSHSDRERERETYTKVHTRICLLFLYIFLFHWLTSSRILFPWWSGIFFTFVFSFLFCYKTFCRSLFNIQPYISIIGELLKREKKIKLYSILIRPYIQIPSNFSPFLSLPLPSFCSSLHFSSQLPVMPQCGRFDIPFEQLWHSELPVSLLRVSARHASIFKTLLLHSQSPNRESDLSQI